MLYSKCSSIFIVVYKNQSYAKNICMYILLFSYRSSVAFYFALWLVKTRLTPSPDYSCQARCSEHRLAQCQNRSHSVRPENWTWWRPGWIPSPDYSYQVRTRAQYKPVLCRQCFARRLTKTVGLLLPVSTQWVCINFICLLFWSHSWPGIVW